MKENPPNLREFMSASFARARKLRPEQMESAGDRVLRSLQKETEWDSEKPLIGSRPVVRDRRWRLALAAAALAVAVLSLPFLKALVLPSHVYAVYAIVETVNGSVYRVDDGKTLAVNVGERIDAGTPVRTEGGAAAVLKLSDGSHIEMHEKSELSFERALDGTRIRLNDGSVNVTPSAQPAGNLYVQNRDVTVPVVGTTFQSARPPAVIGEDALKFEIVSVRPRPSVPSQGNLGPAGRGPGGPVAATACNLLLPLVVKLNPGRIVMTNVSLYQLITLAYGKNCRISLELKLLSGGPDWMEWAGFDIQATLPEGTPTYTLQQLGSGNAPQIQSMLQNLLAERFKLTLHRSMKEVPTYNVVLMSQTTVKLSADQNPSSPPAGRTIEIRYNPLEGTVSVAAASVPMATFLEAVQGTLGRVVVDKTGLKGLIDIPRQTFDVGSLSLDWSSWLPGIFRRIGLNMGPSRESVEALIIDHAEKPSEN